MPRKIPGRLGSCHRQLCCSRIYSRFSPEARTSHTSQRSVICLPIISNRGQIFGCIYLSNKYPFPGGRMSLLTLLSQQASVAISNSLLFRSVQQATKANIQMISSQKQALEEARKAREAAEKAMKVCHPNIDMSTRRFNLESLSLDQKQFLSFQCALQLSIPTRV
jgi:GAF domain-containing protein